jgi:hypothetical protein
MKLLSALVRLLSLFALLGMLLAPVSVIAAEFAMADVAMSTDADMREMAVMQDDKSCCPDEQPLKPACDKSCPFVIICSGPAPLALLKLSWTSASLTWNPHTYADERHERLNSLPIKPPARPPKA